MANGARNIRKQARVFLKEAVLLLPRVVQLLYRLMRDPQVSKADKVLVGAVVAYVASPIDVIPDMIPFFGQLDDLFAVSLVLLRLIGNSGEEVIRRHWTGAQDLIPWIHEVARFSKIFLPDGVVRSIFGRFGAKV